MGFQFNSESDPYSLKAVTLHQLSQGSGSSTQWGGSFPSQDVREEMEFTSLVRIHDDLPGRDDRAEPAKHCWFRAS